MSVQKVDRRIARTKRMIREALAALIEEKGFESITVRDITSEADINRGTFYLHYQDKFDLLKKCENEFFQEIEDIAKDIKVNDIRKFSENQQPLAYSVKLLEYIKNNAAFMRAVLGPNGNVAFQIKLKEYIKTNIGKVFLKEAEGNKDRMKVPREYLLSYIVSAHLGVIQQWLQNELKESPQEIARYIGIITVEGPFQASGFKK
ncbi:TetR/AcrR family transcriptional regulator [Salipaludibacillus daqingensis]|uniref:TetR/AcrR family transcriptional regulator n=1 Tax=Salipaludibacillus daqingensis TaxID=3041001 RepID=UPI0024733ECF|nr:TetR/AcrR family transcriptional regulator [Salipaludibacillus daqingensis]